MNSNLEAFLRLKQSSMQYKEPVKINLAPAFATHNITPNGIIETEEWSESRNYTTVAASVNGVTYKI